MFYIGLHRVYTTLRYLMDLFNFKGINYFLLYQRTLLTPAVHRLIVQLIEPSVSAHENVSAKRVTVSLDTNPYSYCIRSSNCLRYK